MLPPIISRFSFSVRTRQGLVLGQVQIPGRDAQDAERKLRQIYRDCEVLDRPAAGGYGAAQAFPLFTA